MSTVQCPLCGLRFGYRSQFELHAREDHVKTTVTLPHREEVPPPREPDADEHAPVMHLPW